MKKKKILIVVLVLFFVTVGVAAYFSTKKNADTDIDKTDKDEPIHFVEQGYYLDLENGWTSYMVLGKNIIDEKGTLEKDYSTYEFGADNARYKTLEGYYVPIVNENTNEVVEKASVSIPSYAQGEKTSQDCTNINNFLAEKKFQTEITENDLSDLILTTIDKKDLVQMFNQALKAKPLELGKYKYCAWSDIVQKKTTQGYIWQVGYILNYGNIERVAVDLIDKDGNQLSDKVKQNKASKEEKTLHEYIQQVEKQIIEKQNFSVEIDTSIKMEITVANKKTQLNTKGLVDLLKKVEKDGTLPSEENND